MSTLLVGVITVVVLMVIGLTLIELIRSLEIIENKCNEVDNDRDA